MRLASLGAPLRSALRSAQHLKSATTKKTKIIPYNIICDLFTCNYSAINNNQQCSRVCTEKSGERAKQASLDEDENTRAGSREMAAAGYNHHY
tara:strand:- start:23 stop:301 length:279 start_codon:yes stop_codon:yes gene_type:complete